MTASIDFLATLPAAQVRRLLSAGLRSTVPAGAVVVHKGQPVDALVFVLSGSLEVRADVDAPALATLGDGEVVGEMSFVDPQRASAWVVAAETSELLALTTPALSALLDEDPWLAIAFYRSAARTGARRMRATLGRIERNGGDPVPVVVALDGGNGAMLRELARLRAELTGVQVQLEGCCGRHAGSPADQLARSVARVDGLLVGRDLAGVALAS